jgi:hypothetical protein
MGIFKNIIGNSSTEGETQKTDKAIKTVPDLFIKDIQNIQYDTYVGGNTEKDSVGKEIKLYRKILDYRECGIFDTVEVVYLSPMVHNVNFSNHNWNRDIRPLQKLIDNLYLLLGDDYSKEGRFNTDDKLKLTNKNFWAGRMWSGPWSPMLSLDDTDNKDIISLSIHCESQSEN